MRASGVRQVMSSEAEKRPRPPRPKGRRMAPHGGNLQKIVFYIKHSALNYPTRTTYTCVTGGLRTGLPSTIVRRAVNNDRRKKPNHSQSFIHSSNPRRGRASLQRCYKKVLLLSKPVGVWPDLSWHTSPHLNTPTQKASLTGVAVLPCCRDFCEFPAKNKGSNAPPNTLFLAQPTERNTIGKAAHLAEYLRRESRWF